jgi:MurNAc alpha-1-phosphate uridylyltransferase
MRPFPLMLFAAGRGTRMGALTADRPKPLLQVAGKSLIDHAMALAEAADVAPKVANLHYRGEMLAETLTEAGYALSWEETLLETGGGLRQALPLLGPGPVMTLNSDAVWTGDNPLRQLAARWDDRRMDGLLLLLPAAQASGHAGTGDFLRDADGRLSRANGAPGDVYLGAQILRTEDLAGIPQQVFSLNLIWDRMISCGRLFGVIHQGGWCDVGRPEGIAVAEALLAGAQNA